MWYSAGRPPPIFAATLDPWDALLAIGDFLFGTRGELACDALDVSVHVYLAALFGRAVSRERGDLLGISVSVRISGSPRAQARAVAKADSR
jgi:hypothetical protein